MKILFPNKYNLECLSTISKSCDIQSVVLISTSLMINNNSTLIYHTIFIRITIYASKLMLYHEDQ